jgi:hypothetical protein
MKRKWARFSGEWPSVDFVMLRDARSHRSQMDGEKPSGQFIDLIVMSH